MGKDTIETHYPLQSDENIAGLLNTSPIPSRKISISTIIAGVLALFLVTAFGSLGFYYLANKKPEKTESSNVNKKFEESNDKLAIPTAETKNQMVLIQGGNFQMGRSDVPTGDLVWQNQFPAHPVSVNSFYISKTEVSNAEYAEFLQTTHFQAPSRWSNNKPPDGQEKLPVSNVSLSDAKAYADWVSKRDKKICQLPTEEQWEFVARNGTQQTAFPWGNAWKAKFCKYRHR